MQVLPAVLFCAAMAKAEQFFAQGGLVIAVVKCALEMKRIVLMVLSATVLCLGMSGAIASSGHTSDASLVNSTITGLGDIGGDFEFLDDDGKLRRLSDLRGNVVSVFFGFTSCPDVCPGYLAKTTAVREMLGETGDKFKVVFITIDPDRDDRLILQNYLRLFGEGNIGARIPGGKLPEVLKLYSASTHHFHDRHDNLVVSHSVGSYLIDTHGNPRYYVSGSKKAEEMLDLVKELIDA